MRPYRIPNEEAKLAMAPNVFDVLTVIERSKIAIQGIAWVNKKDSGILNARIQATHPTTDRFVNTLEILAREYVTRRKAVMSGLAKPPERKQFQLPRAPKLPNEKAIVTSESDNNETAEDVVVGIEISDSCVSDFSSEYIESEGDCGPDLCFDFDGAV
ncbi:Hypothetical protein PHPALM_8579 [Phytophthora palmivora]|uniref:Uncharacterized protein n=1 Tax=Phytophthora palmivora TaxID=4796 RepID=A0A2P4Y9H5_9STRA|nr:Hypothetical protein PHPALM_8579 [Phytophthora palmivora]